MTTAAAAGAGRVRPIYTRIGVLGLGMIAATIAVWLVAGTIMGSEDVGFFAVVMAIPAVAAFLEWRFGTWAAIVGIAASALVAFGLFWVVFGLATPGSPLDFVSGITIPLGAVLGIGGSVAALVQKRRGHLEDHVMPGEKRIVRAVGGLVAVALVVSVSLMFIGRETVDATAAAGATSVGQKNFEFSPATFEADAGGKLLVKNGDPFAHDVAIPALGIEAVALNPGSSTLLDLSGAEPGTYTVYCTLHSDTDESDPEEAGMAAKLVVK
ncbi:MAG: cupredoxin domain-containing protein [Nitriliruptorales bacterium]|nr:cupredoxin domain-containing protein [Nitriliruptorales bacterium]